MLQSPFPRDHTIAQQLMKKYNIVIQKENVKREIVNGAVKKQVLTKSMEPEMSSGKVSFCP
jgi:hypothetical protein